MGWVLLQDLVPTQQPLASSAVFYHTGMLKHRILVRYTLLAIDHSIAACCQWNNGLLEVFQSM